MSLDIPSEGKEYERGNIQVEGGKELKQAGSKRKGQPTIWYLINKCKKEIKTGKLRQGRKTYRGKVVNVHTDATTQHPSIHLCRPCSSSPSIQGHSANTLASIL